MIPALLSCLYVAYLYKTLNATETSEETSDRSDVETQLSTLTQRVEELTQTLGNSNKKAGT